MTTPHFENVTKNRKSKFVHFRWLLFIWLAAVAAVHAGTAKDLGSPIYLLFGVFVLSQALLAALPLKYYDGMGILNAIFLLDLNFILIGFGISHQLQPELLVTLFLGTFIAALSHSMSQAVATTVVIISVYLGFKMRTPEGFNFMQPDQLLQLPFLFISSMHSSLLAQEAASELDARHSLHNDKQRLSRHMNSTFAEIAHYCKDMSALVDALPFGAIMLDAEGKVRVCNDIAEEVMGVDANVMIGSDLDIHTRAAMLKPYLQLAMNEPLSDFFHLDLPADMGGSWSLNLGIYPVREGEINRGLLIVLIPKGYGDAIKEALPLVLPSEATPLQPGVVLKPAMTVPGLSLAELGLNYG